MGRFQRRSIPFLANAKVRVEGPVQVGLRIRTKADGEARLQWRTEGQDKFPASGQSRSFAVEGGDWEEMSVRLSVEGRLVHLRLYPPSGKQPVEIDWIEIGPESENGDRERRRWDFGAASRPEKPKPKPNPNPTPASPARN